MLAVILHEQLVTVKLGCSEFRERVHDRLCIYYLPSVWDSIGTRLKAPTVLAVSSGQCMCRHKMCRHGMYSWQWNRLSTSPKGLLIQKIVRGLCLMQSPWGSMLFFDIL